MKSLFFFDNYVRPANELGNYNMVVIGKSGSGKSVFIQEYTDSIWHQRDISGNFVSSDNLRCNVEMVSKVLAWAPILQLTSL